MPEPPDFDLITASKIAARLLWLAIENTDPRWNAIMREIVQELRLTWNTRGAADLATLEIAYGAEAHPSMKTLERVIRALDR